MELGADLEQELEHDLAMPIETDVNWEVVETPDEFLESQEPVPSSIVEEVVLAEPAAPAKPRKARVAKAGAKTPRRKPAAKRKAKEPEAAGEE